MTRYGDAQPSCTNQWGRGNWHWLSTYCVHPARRFLVFFSFNYNHRLLVGYYLHIQGLTVNPSRAQQELQNRERSIPICWLDLRKIHNPLRTTQLRRWHSQAWSAVLRPMSMPFLVAPVRLERRRNKYKELPSHPVPVCPALYTWRQCSCAQHVTHVICLLSRGGLQGSADSQWGWEPGHRGAHQGGRVEMTLDAVHSIFVPLCVFLLTDTRVTLPLWTQPVARGAALPARAVTCSTFQLVPGGAALHH